MPHDRNSKPIRAGDKVMLVCVVESVSANETTCNVTLAALDRLGTGEARPAIACNSRLVELVAPAAPEPIPAEPAPSGG